MGRTAYAFRDLDEELHAMVQEDGFVHIYESHRSPPSCNSNIDSSSATTTGKFPTKKSHHQLSDSMVLQRYVDHQRTQRRRKLMGGALFVGAALLGIVPMLLQAQALEAESTALELALAAPYKALRAHGQTRQQYSKPVDEEDMHITDRLEFPEPNVGDADPHDDDQVTTINTEEHEGDQGKEDPDESVEEELPISIRTSGFDRVRGTDEETETTSPLQAESDDDLGVHAFP